ncbi:hypothetical protein IAU59_003373 [Kwoniella sp. CBS 9459]
MAERLSKEPVSVATVAGAGLPTYQDSPLDPFDPSEDPGVVDTWTTVLADPGSSGIETNATLARNTSFNTEEKSFGSTERQLAPPRSDDGTGGLGVETANFEPASEGESDSWMGHDTGAAMFIKGGLDPQHLPTRRKQRGKSKYRNGRRK